MKYQKKLYEYSDKFEMLDCLKNSGFMENDKLLLVINEDADTFILVGGAKKDSEIDDVSHAEADVIVSALNKRFGQ